MPLLSIIFLYIIQSSANSRTLDSVFLQVSSTQDDLIHSLVAFLALLWLPQTVACLLQISVNVIRWTHNGNTVSGVELFKFSCFGYKNLSKSCLYLYLIKEEILNCACLLQLLRVKDYPIWIHLTVYKIFSFYRRQEMPWFSIQQTHCDLLAISVVRYWMYSKFSRVLHFSLILMWMCLCFAKLAMRCQSVTMCVVFGRCTMPLSTSQQNV